MSLFQPKKSFTNNMEQPLSEDEITSNANLEAEDSSDVVEVTGVFDKTYHYLVNLDELLNMGDDDAIWVFGVGGPA